MTKKTPNLLLLIIILLNCENPTGTKDYFYFGKISYPTVAETNSYIQIGDDGSITFSSNFADSTGSFMVYNCRNKGWPDQTNISIDRYNPYWIAGEFMPFFNDNTERNTPYNLIHLYHSVFVRYQPHHFGNKSYNFFQFAFVPDWQSWMWLRADTKRNALKFKENDIIRYIASMDHDKNQMDLWIKNIRTGQIAHGESKNHDYPYRPPTNLSVPIREIFIGSGSHGNYYGEETLGRGRETFWGIIDETIICQGKINIGDVHKWLELGRDYKISGNIKYDLTNSSRETLIQLTNWKIISGNSLKLGGESQLWTDVRQTLQVDANEITNDVFRIIKENDLKRRYLLFAARTDEVESFSFNVKVKGDGGNEKWLKFSPKFSQINSQLPSVEIPINMKKQQWKNFKHDMLHYFNYLQNYKAREITVLKFKIYGKCAIADILLTNNTDFL